jgi:hypothetical protein
MSVTQRNIFSKIIWFKKNGRLLLRSDERDYNRHKEEHQEIPGQGRCLIVLCIQDNKAFPEQGRLFDFYKEKTLKNESCCCGCDRAGRYQNA